MPSDHQPHAPHVTAPPIQPSAAPPAHPSAVREALDNYHTMADTVGMVPSLRIKDNVFQALFMIVFVPICIAVGGFTWGVEGAVIGLFAGLIGGIILSGIVLMVLGWMRTIRKMRRAQR